VESAPIGIAKGQGSEEGILAKLGRKKIGNKEANGRGRPTAARQDEEKGGARPSGSGISMTTGRERTRGHQTQGK